MRIIFALRGLYPESEGGGPRVAYNLIKHLSSRKDIVIDAVHPGYRHCLKGIASVNEYPMKIGRNNFRFKKGVAAFLNSKEDHYDCGFSDGFSMIGYLRNRQFPILYHHHSFRWFQYWDYMTYFKYKPVNALHVASTNLIRRVLTKYMVKNVDYVVSQSGALSEILRQKVGVKAHKILLAPSPGHTYMNPQQVNNTLKIENSFLFVGSLVYYKGLVHLISAFNKIKHAQLFIIGDGPLRQKLERMSSNPNVHFLGQVSDEDRLKDWYRKCECFLFPTLSEGSPLVLSEALSFGMPAIATNVGGTGQFLSNNNALIIHPGKPTEIIKAVYDFMSLTSSQKQQMGQASLELFRSLPDWPQTAEVFYNTFLKMTQNRREPR